MPPILTMLRRHKKKSIAGIVGLILLALLIWGLTRPAAPEYITATAARGDLRQIVEAVGTVISERDLELKFGTTGIVAQVLVREGDMVRAGQRLAQLKAGSLSANVAAQAAALQSAQADLRALEEGTRPEDIAIAEADLQNKRASLMAARQTLASAEQNIAQAQEQLSVLQREADTALAGQVTTSLSTIHEQLTAVENALSTIDDVLSRTDVSDAIVKNRPGADAEIRVQKSKAGSAIADARTAAVAAAGYTEVLSALSSARTAGTVAGTAMDSLFSLISSLRETQSFDALTRESVKASIASERNKIQNATSAITSSLSSLQNASASYDSKISAQQTTVTSQQGTRDRAKADIMTYEAAVRSGEAQLQLKKAGARQTDIDAARARVRQAQANLARSSADFSDTILTAPVSGTVTHVNIRIGESTPSGAAITLLGESPYRVEMFASEIDIPKVQLTQSGSIELDAFRGTHFALRVGDIDPASTDKDGVPKYRVRLDFVHRHDDLKIGMTGDAEIFTGERKDVVRVPARAVLDNPSGSGGQIVRILNDDEIEERPVTVGMEGEGGDVEVEGVEEGEVVIVLIKQ